MKHKLLKWLIGDEFELVPKKQPVLLGIKSKKELIEECLENIDFKKIEIVMKRLKWTWQFSETSPTIKELKEAAEEQLYSACALAFDAEYNLDKTGKRIDGPFTSSCGGFRAEVYLDDTCTYFEYMRLVFEVTEWEVEQD